MSAADKSLGGRIATCQGVPSAPKINPIKISGQCVKEGGFASWSTTRGIVHTISDGVYQKWPPMKRGSTPQKEKKAMAIGLLINFVIPYCRRYAIMPTSLPAKYWIHQGKCLVLYRTAGKLQDAHQDYSPKPWNVLQSSSRSHSSTLRGPPQHSEATRLESWNMYVP